MKHFALCLLVFTTVPCLFSQEFGEAPTNSNSTPTLEERIEAFDEALIPRPRSADETLEPITRSFVIDGIEGRHLALKGESISFKTAPLNLWQHDPSSNAENSITFKNRYEPTVIIAVSIFEKSRFQISREDNSLLAFLAGLKQLHRAKIAFNDIPEDFRPSGFVANILRQPTSMVDYTITRGESERMKTRFLTYFTELENQVIEFRLEGPEEKLDTYKNDFHYFLRNMSIVQDEAEAFGE